MSSINLNELKPWEFFGIYNPTLYNGLTSSILNSYSQTSFGSYSGAGNNLSNPTWGKAGEILRRVAPLDYGPGDLAIRGSTNPNPRVVSNLICQGASVPNDLGLTDMVWLYGQITDHLLDLTPTQDGESAEKLPITTPPDDTYPGLTIPFTRSIYSGESNVRQQPNDISAFIDGTNVYGHSTTRAYALRRLDGTGKLKTTTGDTGEVLLPYNTEGLPNATPPGSTPSDFFLAGDVRANEVATLTGMHTVFVREHNRLCDKIVEKQPSLAGQEELIYQKARRWVAAFMQNITFNEFIPALLGGKVIAGSYDKTVQPDIANEFSTVGYRLGHTMVSSEVQLGNNPGNTIMVRDMFFTPGYVKTNGVNDMLYGATQRPMQNIDGILVEDLRSFLFGPPEGGMMHDLAALNIQRGRDHGIPGYNAIRKAYGLSTFVSFDDIPTSSSNRTKLAALYDSPDSIDPWIGAIIENHLPGEAVGELVHAILVEQCTRLKRGNRYCFEEDPAFTGPERVQIRYTKLSDIMSRNTSYTFPANVFRLN